MHLSSTVNPIVSYIAIGTAICIFFYIVHLAYGAVNKLETITSQQEVIYADLKKSL
jgi:hypothetical protein